MDRRSIGAIMFSPHRFYGLGFAFDNKCAGN